MRYGNRGFSLIELVLVILVLAVAAVALATQFSQSVAGIGLDHRHILGGEPPRWCVPGERAR